ncbi:ribosomal-protein-alanine N-acetyltransferase [Flavobacterium sp. 90]|uniref:GNAT family N-acetyltransferase n=1 Tax=unclassified Flavobacterium TaxID=196869 RepID=UPI000EB407C1|nr:MULTISPECIES: GNAT family N-acetyltransferase [unclassified Flavobacterium]RKR05345.1 ribosomal-protein-alanine N-acetyltransferase [Flavobacterium sp. 81]TCK56659.1 ribosomal-protein-alanine N-acetyltransferase [Flavobacterium sp. 90]
MMNLQTFPILITDRFTLRKLSKNDSEEILQLRSDKEINKFLDRKLSKTLEDALNFIDNIIENDDLFYWAITKTDENKLIGTICLFDFIEDSKKCEIGYELLTQYQGQGVMSEAAKKVIDYAGKTLGIKIINAQTHKENQSSTKLLEKLNFKKLESVVEDNPNLILLRLTI